MALSTMRGAFSHNLVPILPILGINIKYFLVSREKRSICPLSVVQSRNNVRLTPLSFPQCVPGVGRDKGVGGCRHLEQDQVCSSRQLAVIDEVGHPAAPLHVVVS